MEVEVISGAEGIIVTDFHSPSVVTEGVHDDLVFVLEAEVNMEDDMRTGEQLNGEVVVVTEVDMAVDVDLRSVVDLLVESDDSGNGLEIRGYCILFNSKNH